jgi:carbonic anhydrase
MKSIKLFVVSFLIGFLTLLLAPSAQSSPLQLSQSLLWTYSGEARTEKWGDLSSEFVACKQGKQQSPIALDKTFKASLESIEFDYKDSPFEAINNGHTIEVKYEHGSSIKIEGKQYELRQFHFHAPSEHTIGSQKYPIELHLVHKSQDGELAVIGVFLKEGKPNELIQTLLANLPAKEGEKTVKDIRLNASALSPTDKSYYHYSGSLTTPPCSEGVNWYVLKTPIEVSQEQIAKFASVYSGNARPTQPLNQRVIEVKE